jgi:thiamine biosynthesis lipoprotein
MQRRTLLSATLGLGALTGLSSLVVCDDHEALAGLRLHSGCGLAFGTTVSIKVLHTDALLAQTAIECALQQVRKIDTLMSLHQQASQIFLLNQLGSLDQPHDHVLQVLTFAQHLSALTDGAFDITVQPLWQIFSQASAQGTLPTPTEIAAAKAHVNWQRVELSERRIQLGSPGMAITLNGVAQGYAVDLAMAALLEHGVQHALLDTGEFGTIGSKAQNQAWLLGVGHPRQHDSMAATLKMDGRKVATSGDYETFFSPDFVHHHIFDPASGDSPLELASVTVVAPTGLLADGLSTAFMVMGTDKALALTAQMQDVDALLIDKHGVMRATSNFPALST